MRAILAVVIAAVISGAASGATEKISCQTANGVMAYRLDIDWNTSKAAIAVKSKGVFKTLFTGASVVRNTANDPSLLAEGAADNYAGDFQGRCGRFIERLNFDLRAQAGKRVGTVVRETVWATVKGLAKPCVPKQGIPELLTALDEVTCQ